MTSLTTIGVGILRKGEQFLVGVRSSGSSLAGFAEFPGGKLESGETVEQCVHRECLEETGFDVTVGELILRKRHTYDHGGVDLHFFDCRVSNETTMEPCGAFRWVSREELMSLSFPEANSELLPLL